jgi:hypothetical protein
VVLGPGLLVDGQRLPEQGLGLGIVPLRIVQRRQAVQVVGVVGVALPQGLLVNGQRLLRQGLSLGVVYQSPV